MRSVVSEAELAHLGEALGKDLTGGAVVWLEGELGAGKTTLAQAIVRGLGADRSATSPTYGLVHRYELPRGSVSHVDCYRLRSPDEARDLDWESLAQSTALVIEWPERAGAWAARPTHRIQLGHTVDPLRRWIEVSG
jgi:tRNA threonylcarbamoyladenosine biosynthesis protein TsaE